jgi:protein-S-isoprenylcysteine O-methyltransferase
MGDFFNLQIYLYVLSLCVYHFMEYVYVALYHTEDLSFNSNIINIGFLINHSSSYVIATSASIFEVLVENYFFHSYKFSLTYILIGLIVTIVGHFFRIGAMFTAKRNFTHIIATRKKEHHVLVTDGLYSISRHPSYFGFFWWSIGTQILCANPICLVGFCFALWTFFNDRIAYEEFTLIGFFGPEYMKFKESTPVLIPCI